MGLCPVLVPGLAHAEKAADAARAEALFDEGRKLMASRDFANACPKLAESQRLDPAPGTELNLAVCYERWGKTAAAWAAYKAAELGARRAGEVDRAAAAGKKAAELEPRLPRVTITVPASARVQGLEVRCDGEPVREPTWGVALPYDPGPHDVRASAPGHAAWSMHLELTAGAAPVAVTVPALEAVETPAPAAVRDAEAEDPTRGRGQRIAGGVIAGLGAAGVAFGVFAGLHAKSKYDDALAACGETNVCPDGRGPALRNDAGNWATGSTVAFAVGAGVLAGGALLFFTAPRAHARSLAVGPAAQGTGLSLSGSF